MGGLLYHEEIVPRVELHILLVVIVSLLYHLTHLMEQQTLEELKFFKNSDGTSSDSKILYDANDNGSQGKSSGLGDLELLTDPAPVEIGNRVWLDSDRDGIQGC